MGEQLFQVEKIVGGPNDKSHFLIKWEGYPEDQNTWEPLQHLPADMVREYLATLPGRPEYTGALGKKPANVSKQGRSKRQKKPGVDIAKDVEDDIGKEVEDDSEKHAADWVGEDEDEDEPRMLDPKRRATKEKKAAKVSKQGRSKRQKIPAVDIAKEVEDDSEEHDADWVGEDEDEDETMMLGPKRQATKEKKATETDYRRRSKCLAWLVAMDVAQSPIQAD